MKTTGAAAVGINMLLAADYYRGWTQPERNTVLDSGVEEVPGFYGIRTALRSYRGQDLPQLPAPEHEIKLLPVYAESLR